VSSLFVCIRCTTDYVDVYTQAQKPFQDLLEVPLHGRYCGDNVAQLPGLLVSMYSVFVVGFYSDQHKEERGFEAEYSFIDGCKLLTCVLCNVSRMMALRDNFDLDRDFSNRVTR